MNNGTHAPGDDDGSPWTQPRFLAAAMVLGLIVLLGIVLSLTAGKGDSPAATESRPRPAASAPPPNGCDLSASDERIPTTTPEETRWELVGKMIAPTAPTELGPGRVDDGFRTCFARTPKGALYAAVNFWATSTAKTDAETYRRLAVDSPTRDAAIKAARDQTTPQLNGLQVAGFAFSAYDERRASVKLAFRLEDGRLVAADTTLLWTGGDWRYEIPLDQGRGAVSQIADLAGFVAWKGA